MRRAVWAALVLLAAAPAPVRAAQLEERSPAVSAKLSVRADFASRATTVHVRGRARVRSRRVALVLIRCSTPRCVRPGRRERAARRLRRGPRSVRATLRVGRARYAQLELWVGRPVRAHVRLRAPAGPALRPAPALAPSQLRTRRPVGSSRPAARAGVRSGDPRLHGGLRAARQRARDHRRGDANGAAASRPVARARRRSAGTLPAARLERLDRRARRGSGDRLDRVRTVAGEDG